MNGCVIIIISYGFQNSYNKKVLGLIKMLKSIMLIKILKCFLVVMKLLNIK